MVIKIASMSFEDYPDFHYIFKLDNNDEIAIKEEDYNRKIIHTSKLLHKYEAIVDEDDRDEEGEVNYLAFRLIG